MQPQGDVTGPQLGYRVTRRLLERKERFTALFAFNDIFAIGAIGALRDSKLKVPSDVSVIGFDDIQSAARLSEQTLLPFRTQVLRPYGSL